MLATSPRHRRAAPHASRASSWSERLLDDELLAAFHDFSVFAGPVRAGICLLRSACNGLPCSVCATGRPMLVLARIGVRCTALETVRSYGRELREEGTYDEALRRRRVVHVGGHRAGPLVRTADEAAR